MTANIKRLAIGAILVSASVSQAWPQPQITAIVNAASFQSGLPTGGALATIFCSGVPGVKPGSYQASGFPLPYTLGGLHVAINNGFAPLLAVAIDSSGNAQINFQVPFERNVSLIPVGGYYTGQLGACGATMTAFPQPSSWGGFFADANGYAIAQHASDYSLVTPQNPAHAGETIVAYADDFFSVWPPPPLAIPTPQQPLFQIAAVVAGFPSPVGSSQTGLYLQTYPSLVCLIGLGCNNSFASTPALQVTFEGLAPGQIGVEQINFVIPTNQQPGDWALFFNTGSCLDGRPSSQGQCGNPGGGSSPYVKLPVR